MITIEKAVGNLVEIKIPEYLEPGDFKTFSPAIDNIINQHGKIRLLLDAKDFKGWKNLDIAKEHFQFVKAHQHFVKQAAVIAGHQWQHWIAAIGDTFLEPDIKVFDDATIARTWIEE